MQKSYSALEEMAYDLSWSWDHKTDRLWETLDADLWALTRNPLVILQTVSQQKLRAMLEDPKISKIISELQQAAEEFRKRPTWFQQTYPEVPLTNIAYFSMEFMVSEALPIYSGGLGNIAGDQLKAMSDLGVPAVGVGLLYQQGYFRQVIDSNGMQQALRPYNSPDQLPIQPVRASNGEWVRIEIDLPGWKVWLRAWEAQIGRIKLYLLDSNDAANYPPHRTITSELYGGNEEMRLQQEIALGIGGWKLLRVLGIAPEVCHINEGHAAFAVLERARQYKEEKRCSFAEAFQATRVGNLFTTHTAVPAGFDRFAPALLETYLGFYIKEHLGISMGEFLALGSLEPGEPFNMTYLGIRGSGAVNAVSALHEQVSRRLFAPLGVTIGHVTNGIHVRSWDSAASDSLWTETCGHACWLGEVQDLENKIRAVPDSKIWQMRQQSRKEMIEFGRDRMIRILHARGAPKEQLERMQHLFDPHALTLGFARRFAAYKRPNLLLSDIGRLMHILTNRDKPVQLILAGKAHPADEAGQKLIQQWIEFIRRPEVRQSVVFISDYDMSITEHLVAGVDLWINTPRRPWEACGTSGMKILVNGGLNLSTLDGWWAEAYQPEVGWAIGDHQELSDAEEASLLYDRLEKEIIPEFYNRNQDGIPTAWVARIRESMARLTPRFSTNRSLREYMEKYYLPAAKKYLGK